MGNRKLRILILMADYYNPKYPARTGVMELYGNYFPKFGHEVVWIVPGSVKHTEKRKYNSIDFYIIPYQKHTNPIKRIMNQILYEWRKKNLIKNLLRSSRFDIIQARNNVFNGLWGIYFRYLFHIPFVYQITFLEAYNDFDEKKFSLFLYILNFSSNIVNRLIFRQANLILPISRFMGKQLVISGVEQQKVFPLPMAVNTEKFRPDLDLCDLKKKYKFENITLFVYVGSMAKMRQLEIVIKAFESAKKQVSNIKLMLVGDGSGKDSLIHLSQQYSLEDSIIFTGNVPYEEVPKYVGIADIGLSPIPPIRQYLLSSPTKVMEYAAVGKPVIANREILEMKDILTSSGAGLLVDFDAISFSQAMVKLVSGHDNAQKMGQQGREWMVKHRSYASQARALEKRYFQLIREFKMI